uniref:Uncharacterized protein n=1 Tax=Macrostomum lignano TaxID=282301 RepID=A0A1I8F314_9PLAT
CLLVQDAIVRARRSILDSSLWPEPAPRLQRPPKLPSLGDSFRRQSAYGVTSMRMPEPADAAPSPVPLSLVRVEVQRPCNESGGRLMWPSVKMNESFSARQSEHQCPGALGGAMYGLRRPSPSSSPAIRTAALPPERGLRCPTSPGSRTSAASCWTHLATLPPVRAPSCRIWYAHELSY